MTVSASIKHFFSISTYSSKFFIIIRVVHNSLRRLYKITELDICQRAFFITRAGGWNIHEYFPFYRLVFSCFISDFYFYGLMLMLWSVLTSYDCVFTHVAVLRAVCLLMIPQQASFTLARRSQAWFMIYAGGPHDTSLQKVVLFYFCISIVCFSYSRDTSEKNLWLKVIFSIYSLLFFV